MLSRLPAVAALALFSACAASPQPAMDDDGTLAGDVLSGRFAAGERDLPQASARYQEAAAQSDDPELARKAFEYALAAGDVRAAAAYAERLIGEPPEGPPDHASGRARAFQADDLPRLTLAAVALEEGDAERALDLLSAPYTSALGRSLAFMLEGWAIFDEEGADAATEYLSTPPDGVFPGFVPLHAGLMFDLDDMTDEAAGTYAAALETPGALDAATAFALLQEREGRDQDAADLYRQMVDQRGLSRRIGRMGLARLGEPVGGESEAFLRLAEDRPERIVEDARDGAALVFAGFAQAAYEQATAEQQAAARAGFGQIDLFLNAPLGFARLATFLDDDQPTAQYIAGAIVSNYGQDALAEAAYAKVPPSSAYYNYAVIYRADALIRMDRTDEATALLRDYLEQDSLSPDVAQTLAGLYAEREAWDEAYDAGTAAIEAAQALAKKDEAAPGDAWRYYFSRGATAVEADDWTRGEADLVQALELAPDEPLVLNYLGYSYAERGERLDDAFEMIERALRLEPNSGAITDSLGWAHYQRGDYEAAVRYLEDAVRLEPGDDVITDHLGDAYWQTGRERQARYEWRRVLEIEDLDAEMRADVEAKLAGRPPKPGALASLEDA